MIIRRLLAVLALLVTSLGLVAAAPSAYAAEDCQPHSTPERGRIPICDTANGRTFVLQVEEAAAGATVNFEGTGFKREKADPDGKWGQTLTFKFNDIDPVATIPVTVVAEEDGSVKGEVQLPAAAVFEEYRLEHCSERWWIRVLVGAGRADGDPDGPGASLHAEYALTTDLTSELCPTPDEDDDPSSTTSPTSTPTTTTTTSSSTTPTTSGTLPKTGIEDHGVLLATGGLGLAALLALIIDRRLRRRRLTESA